MDVLKWKFDHAKLSKIWPREGKLKELDTSINRDFNFDYGINLKFSMYYHQHYTTDKEEMKTIHQNHLNLKNRIYIDIF